jgi:hypothetical protein
LDPRNFSYTILTTLLLGAAAGALADWAGDAGVSHGAIGAVILIVFLGLAYWIPRAGQRRKDPVTLKPKPMPAKGLVVLVSLNPGRDSARYAIRYHSINLQHLWMVTTEQAKTDAEFIAEEVKRSYPRVTVHPLTFLTDPNDLREALSSIDELRRQARERHGLGEEYLMCDFTGLTKNASAGMIFACAHQGARLQFMKPRQTDPGGRGIGESDPIEVVISYGVTEE